MESFPHQYGPALTVWQQKKEDGRSGSARILLTLGEETHITPLGSDSHRGCFNWLEVLLARDRRAYVVVQLEQALGLPVRVSTPVTTRASIGPRVLAAFLAQTALEPDRWIVGGGAGQGDDDVFTNDEFFAAMPGVAADVEKHSPLGHPWNLVQSRYWFIGRLKGQEPQPPEAAIDMVAGHAWHGASEIDLLAAYHALGRRLAPVVSRALPAAV